MPAPDRPWYANVNEDTPVPDDLGHFTANEAAAYSGLSYRQVDYLCSKGRIEPDVPACGSGSRRRFRRTQVLAMRALAKLRRAGVAAWPDMGDLERAVYLGERGAWVTPDGTVCLNPPETTEPVVWLPLGDPQMVVSA